MLGPEAKKYIESIGYLGSRLGLERTRELLSRLGNPEKRMKFVHVAGTNGKGSTSTLIASILQAAGYKVGLFTSPHLLELNERMKINGRDIPDSTLGMITGVVRMAAELMQEDPPTEFEVLTAVGLTYFAYEGCDYAVVEVGMGGRLDSTNVIPAPDAAVITNIGLDHTKELGDTLALIAGEKAGIIKPGTETVLYEPYDPSVLQTVKEKCETEGVPLHVADFSSIRKTAGDMEGQQFDYGDLKDCHIRLCGEHQLRNAAVAIETARVLQRKGRAISDDDIRRGLASASWPGRFELMRRDPVFIVDGGHNRQCIEAAVSALKEYFPGKKVTFVVGILADKDYAEMIKLLLPVAARFYTATPASQRALPSASLAQVIKDLGGEATDCTDAKNAVKEAMKNALPEDVICSVGSLYMTGDVRTAVLETLEAKE